MYLLFFLILTATQATLQGAVYDYANILSNQTIKTLNQHIFELRTSAGLYASCNGAFVPREIGIYVTKDVWKNSRELTSDSELERYAKDIHDQLGIGDKECHHGLLLFFNLKQRFLHFSTGKGMKQDVSDSFLLTVVQSMKPFLKNNQLDDALLLGIRNIIGHIENSSKQQSVVSNTILDRLSAIFIMILAVLILVSILIVIFVGPEILLILVANLGIVIWNFLLWIYYSGKNFFQRRRTKNSFEKKIKDLKEKFAGVPLHHMTCCICFEELKVDEKEDEKTSEQSALKMLNCNHVFHTACIDIWLSARSTCPLCRKEAKGDTPQYKKFVDMRNLLNESVAANNDSLFELWLHHHRPLYYPHFSSHRYMPLRSFDMHSGNANPGTSKSSGSGGFFSGLSSGSWNFGGGSSWGGGGVSARW